MNIPDIHTPYFLLHTASCIGTERPHWAYITEHLFFMNAIFSNTELLLQLRVL